MATDVIIPRPATVTVLQGDYLLKDPITINQKGAKTVENYFIKQVKSSFNVKAKTSKSTSNINIKVDASSAILAEGYILDITKSGINITSSTEAGAFYAIQSLLQLMKADYKDGAFTLACQNIQDAPRFGWRAYMLDEACYFKGEEEVYRL